MAPEAASKHGRTALQAAAENSHLNVLGLLISHNARVDLKTLNFTADRALCNVAKSRHTYPKLRRRLIVCCDGTWNSDSTETPLTNIARITRCLKDFDTRIDGELFAQIIHYQSGIGTSPYRLANILDGAFASGNFCTPSLELEICSMLFL